jgi:hypothetical protein
MAFLNIKGAEVGRAVSLVRDFVYLNVPPSEESQRGEYVEKAKEYVKQRWS